MVHIHMHQAFPRDSNPCSFGVAGGIVIERIGIKVLVLVYSSQ